MDSLTQIALGAAVTVAVMRRRTAVRKAAAWGAALGTLPDLDVLIDQGDAIRNMVLHRAESHALFWLALASLPLALAIARLHGETDRWRRWWLAVALALLTHPLLDVLTIYGTRLLLPFDAQPYGLGSVFIIDPLVTLPWLAGTAVALATRASPAGLRANAIGLALGCAYLAWGAVAQQMVTRSAERSLAAQGIAAERLLVQPAAFTSVLWRVVAVAGDQVHEGYHSLLDAPGPITFQRFDKGSAIDAALPAGGSTQLLREFSRGLYKLHEERGRAVISDLRMGAEPTYTFAFEVAERRDGAWMALARPLSIGRRPDIARAWPWFWRRLSGDTTALPPR